MFATNTARIKQSVVMTHHQVRLNLHQRVKNHTNEDEKRSTTEESGKLSLYTKDACKGWENGNQRQEQRTRERDTGMKPLFLFMSSAICTGLIVIAVYK